MLLRVVTKLLFSSVSPFPPKCRGDLGKSFQLGLPRGWIHQFHLFLGGCLPHLCSLLKLQSSNLDKLVFRVKLGCVCRRC